MKTRWHLVVALIFGACGVMPASAGYAAQAPTPKKIGPPVVSGKTGEQAPGGGKGTATLNGTGIRPAGKNAGTTAIPGKR